MHRILLLCALLALSLNAQTLKIVVQSPAVMKELQASGEIPPQVKLVTASGADLTREIADADGFVGGPLSATDLKAAKKLRWVQSFSAGVENQLFLSGNTIMRDSAIVLTNNRIVEGPELADHALAMLLTLTRQLPRFMANQAQEKWQARQSGHPGPERQDRGSDWRRRRGLQHRDARLGVRHERDWRGSRRTIRSRPSSRSM